MSDKKNNNELPDISKVFDIDEKKIPDKIIKKDPESSKKIENPILTSEEARKVLPKEDRKILKKDDKERKRIAFTNKMRKNLIIALAAAAVILIAIFIISGISKSSKIPEITVTTPSVEAISEYFVKENAVTVNSHKGKGKLVVFFDNKYEEHNLNDKNGQIAVITTERGKTIQGKVVEISKKAPDDRLVEEYYNELEGSITSTDVYAVYIQPDDTSFFSEDGERIKSVTVTTQTIEKALILPAEAVITEEGENNQLFNKKHYVWVYSEEDSTVSRLEVTTGIVSEEKIQITGTLEPDAKVVLTCSEDITDIEDGTKVKVKK